MNKKRLFLLLLLITLTACARGNAPAPTDTPPPPATEPAAPEETATVPPVLTPTIVIPTPPPAELQPTPTNGGTPLPAAPPVSLVGKPVFAAFNQTTIPYTPAIFHDPIAPDLGNVIVPFVLSEAQRVRLAADGLVVSPGTEKEFFTIYEKARYANVPVFVTSDSLLHVYHLLFDKVLRTAERESFIPLLLQLNTQLLAQTDAQYQALRGTAWEDAALRTVAFIGVGAKLMDPAVTVPAYAADLVAAELANIEDASAIMRSPIFPGLENGEDYTQYIPRGHYTISEDLTAYFKCMMWYGRMTFRLKTADPDVGRAETRAALLLIHALRSAEVDGRAALDIWLDLYNPTVFFVGRSDDLTAFQYLTVIDSIYGATPDLQTIADESKLDPFITAADALPPPRILGLVISVDDDVEETTKGFRFMGQRFVPDAYIFRQLMYRNVGTQQNPRMLPKGLDIMAAMGSDRAYTLLDTMGETAYLGYPEQMEKMQTWVANLTTEEWTETLYTTWLYTFEPLLEQPGSGYPQFMQSEAWLDKQLNSTLGSWAELKHDTILYAKQAYAELGGGGGPLPRPAYGYVEPVPDFYARLEALTAMTLTGLDERGLLNEQDRNSLQRLQQLAAALQLIAAKELRGEPLSEEEYNLIRFYGGELEHLTMAAADREDPDPFAQPYMDEEPQAAVIADVATAPDPDGDGIPNPVVLEEAVGRINEIYVVVPLINADGTITLQVAKGGVFAYYEFPWPADDRLTDEKWRQMLDNGTAPPLPEWTGSFFTPATEFTEFQQTIYSFQTSIGQGFWYLQADYLYGITDDVRAGFVPDMAALEAAKQYLGRQLQQADYRSFDIQTEDRVIVTVREWWVDELHSYAGDSGSPGDYNEPINRRGPYPLEVTYTLSRGEEGWIISNIVTNNAPPEWAE